MNNNYENTIESFIEFCDEMKIATESDTNNNEVVSDKCFKLLKSIWPRLNENNKTKSKLGVVFRELTDLIRCYYEGDKGFISKIPSESEIKTIGNELYTYSHGPLGLDGYPANVKSKVNSLKLFLIGSYGNGDHILYSLKDSKIYDFVHDSNNTIQPCSYGTTYKELLDKLKNK